MPDVIRVRIEHFAGVPVQSPDFELPGATNPSVQVSVEEVAGELRSGNLSARVHRTDSWRVDFYDHTTGTPRLLTSSLDKSVGAVTDEHGRHFVHEQLALAVSETVYGLGERFGPVVKNGQTVDVWNSDGGTSSERAYKNVPFYLTSAGYGVFVNHPEQVSFEVASEAVSRTQFSVPGQYLEYFLINGPTPKDVLRRYTELTGRPAAPPDWSFGLWLSSSFTTSYDEATVDSFVTGMAERNLPLSVFHFDCFWMRESRWCDFTWDPDVFPDPVGMLARLKARGLRICVWINPYIAARSPMFAEGRERGYLLRTTDGGVWQTDAWQAGMGIVDFTNPDALAWYTGKLEVLLDQGVDAFKTDFGEEIPTEGVRWFDGSSPNRMRNYYSFAYNRAVFDLLRRRRGDGEAVVFARAATAGGQQFPVHWGRDCESSFVSMAETLRGGLSLAMSGFGYWSHDIGGFEGNPDPAVFKRWLAFGLLSSHSRLHGSGSYRVPWEFGDEAVDVARRFVKLKLALMPYLAHTSWQVHEQGVPMLRPLLLEYPDDPAVRYLDTEYLLGPDLLVAPVFCAAGDVDVYVPDGAWTNLLTGARVTGPGWIHERHGFDSLPLLVRPGTVLPVGAVDDRPDYDHTDGVVLHLFDIPDGADTQLELRKPSTGTGAAAVVTFRVERSGAALTIHRAGPAGAWAVALPGADTPAGVTGGAPVADLPGVLLPGPVLRASGDLMRFDLPLSTPATAPIPPPTSATDGS